MDFAGYVSERKQHRKEDRWKRAECDHVKKMQK
jgi:hypothetical protein